MADEIVTISITESPVTIDPVVTETVTITILQAGAQGIKGDTGATGPAGNDAPEVQFEYSDDGSTGWTPTYDANKKYFRSSSDGGSTWSVAIKFEGPTGPTGPAGADGNNWLTGTGAPGAGLGVDGDYYLQNDTGDIWLKSGGVWADTGINMINPFDQDLNTTDSPTFVNLTLSGTDSIKIPVGTTAQRNVTPTEGMIRLNSTLNAFEGYKAGNWTSLGGVIDVDQDTYITAEEVADDDTIRIYTAGLERLIVDPSGNVGVGIDPPTEKLHVVGTGLFDSVKFNIVAGDPPAPSQGEMWWNSDEWTLNLQQNGSTLQLGHEMLYHVHNQTGAQLDNGRPVMFTQSIGASGRGAVAYHDGSDTTKTHLYLGLLTENIANGGQGKVTRFGRVRGINASGAGVGKLCFGTETWLDGDDLYIDPVNPGYLTKVVPADGQVHIHAAWVLSNNAATGTIFAHSNNLDENEFVDYGVLTDWKDPTGWVDNSAITTSYDPVTRKVTLTGDLRYRWRGRLKELTSPYLVDVAHTDADGVYFLYSTDGTTFAWSTTPWEFSDFMMAAVIVLNSTATKIGLREVHGMIVSDAHENFHNYIGTSRISGLGPTGGTYTLDTSTDLATTPGFNSGVIKDEDIKTTIAQTNDGGPYTTLRIGAASAPTFDTAATFPFRNGAGTRIYVNDPATGTETEATNLYYVNVYELLVPVSDDAGSQLYRRLMVQPQFEYQTIEEAEAESTASLDLGLFSLPEFVFYSRLTYRVNASYSNTGKCRLMNITYLAGSRVAQVGIVASGVTTPGGADTQIQFNNTGAFDGDSELVWDYTNKRLGVGTAAPAERLEIAGNLSLNNGVTSTEITIYGTDDGVGNYERGYHKWLANVYRIGTNKAGTGVSRNISIEPAGGVLYVTAANVEPTGINTHDLGNSTYVWRDLYLGNDVNMAANGEVVTASGDLIIRSAGTLWFGATSSLRWGIDATALYPAAGYDIGKAANKVKDLYMSGNITVDGTVDGRDVAADGLVTDSLESISINAVVATSYQLVLTDARKLVTCNNAAGVTITVPPNSTVAFPVGTYISLEQLDGTVTISPGAGVTLRHLDGNTGAINMLGVSAVAGIVKTATNTWTVYGGVDTTDFDVTNLNEVDETVATSPKSSFTIDYNPAIPVIVAVNGVVLDTGSYTQTSGTAVVLGTAAAVGDHVHIWAFETTALADVYSKTDSDARYVNVVGDTVTGDIVLNNTSIAAGKRLIMGHTQDEALYLPNYSTNYTSNQQIHGDHYTETNLAIAAWGTSTSNSGGSFLSLNKSNHGTIGSHATVINTQRIGAIGFAGSDGTKFVGTSMITSDVNGTVSTGIVPADLRLWTSDTSTVQVEGLRIESGGSVYLPQGQLRFPATQNASSNANTLDDYEEGGWTPVLSDGTNSDATYNVQQGRYTKIGDLVHCSFRIDISSLGSITGAVRVTGLPFTVASGQPVYCAHCGYSTLLAITAGYNIAGYCPASNSYITLTLWDAAVGITNLQASEISADGGFIMSLTYKAA